METKKYSKKPTTYNFVSQFCALIFDGDIYKSVKECEEFINKQKLQDKPVSIIYQEPTNQYIAAFKDKIYQNPFYSVVKYDDGVLLQTVTYKFIHNPFYGKGKSQ